MRRAPLLTLHIDPVDAFEALCALEDGRMTDDVKALIAALRVALRPGVRVALAALVRGEPS